MTTKNGKWRNWRDRALCFLAAGCLTLGGIAYVTPTVKPTAKLPESATQLCNTYDWKNVTSAGLWYVLRNDSFGDHECLTNRWDGSNYVVSGSTANSTTSENQAFPELFTGCQYGICTRKTVLPMPWSLLTHVNALVNSEQNAPGLWNSAFDIWFGRNAYVNGQAKGAEIMIWLGTGDNSTYGLPIVTIDGYRWYLSHWRACNANSCWNYVRFWAVSNHIKDVKNFDLVPFMRYSYVHDIGAPGKPGGKAAPGLWKNWWLWNISYGNEIWNGGNGLGVARFRISGLPTSFPPTPIGARDGRKSAQGKAGVKTH